MNLIFSLSPDLRRNLLVLFTAGLLFWSALAALLPTLPLYIRDIGGDSQAIGIVMGMFAIGLLISRSWLAQMADRKGRKIVLLIGMAAVAFAPLGYALTDSIPLLMGIRAAHGLSIAAFALAYSALVVDFSPPAQRGELIGYMSLVNPIGMAIGPAMGGYLQEWLGYLPMFAAAAGLGIIGLLCTAQVQEPPIDRHAESAKSPFWGLLVTPRVRIPAIVLLLIGLAFGTLSTFVPLFVQEAGVDLNVGLFYTAAAIASFSIRLVTGRASDRFGRGVFISISLILYSAAMLLLWRATSAVEFLLAGVLEGAGAGILIPMMAALMADRAMPNERGRIFGVCMVGFDLGIAIAGPLLGTVAIGLGYRGIFGVAGLLSLLGIVVFATLSSKNLAYSLQFAIGRGRDIYAINGPQAKRADSEKSTL
ncbi:MAG: MFS transporter [Microcoleus sp. SIO2G3]|nr:MFS transporter [Microcoleus sp. SIO2G3]